MPEDETAPTSPDRWVFAATEPAAEPPGVGPLVAVAEGAPGVGVEDGPGAGVEERLAGRSPEEAIDEVDRLLEAIEEALAALDDGSYGACRSCGTAIEFSRLAEDPLARSCGSCSSGAAPGSE